MLPKENGSRSRLVIITQGSDPVVAVKDGQAGQIYSNILQNSLG